MYKVVRSNNYSIECWLVVDDNGNSQGSFNNWMDASNYAMSLNCRHYFRFFNLFNRIISHCAFHVVY